MFNRNGLGSKPTSARKPSIPRRSWATLCGLGAGLMVSTLGLGRANAAQRLVVTYGPADRSIPISQLEEVAETGVIPRDASVLRFVANQSNLSGEDLQAILTQELGVSLRFIDDVTYTLPGEYVLFQLGQVFHNRARVAEIQSLRAALINSVSNDGRISLLQFLQNYPNPDLYIDGFRLRGNAQDVANVINDIGDRLAGPIAVAQDLIDSLVCEPAQRD
ncbi:alpha/beta hydrolase [Geitlerinema sp. P-1104]|nr:alpha/beta hydrolase [Geitlerinema sp. P-1104]